MFLSIPSYLRSAALPLAAAVAVLATAPGAAQAASVGADVSVTIQKAVSIAKDADLAFGTVSVGTASGTAVINAGTGATSATGGVEAITGASRAQFTVSGEPNVAVSLGFDPSNGVATLTGTGDDMTVNLTLSASNPTLNGSGAATVFVGGTLNVNANQASGLYSGTFTVTANY